ncbi:hypothetical protein JOD54_006418 [Actinokineospora baliensis]|uniref:hypothetical protein n=1 Tax=Actinokineospora baliensis TaxID=547056 RepID=UPI00195D69D4|nr:hypothetical protein [Actinokineospora baliensis]MBM7776214.1 hypothetical protein [Actinokineospora baliensis]
MHVFEAAGDVGGRIRTCAATEIIGCGDQARTTTPRNRPEAFARAMGVRVHRGVCLGDLLATRSLSLRAQDMPVHAFESTEDVNGRIRTLRSRRNDRVRAARPDDHALVSA